MQLMHPISVLAILLLTEVTRSSSLNIVEVCQQIEVAISSASSVYWPAEAEYNADIYHYCTSSSAEAVCSVEPGTSEDVATTLRILGKTVTPFAVKGGGHTMNPGFSSTTGVQIAMTRFSDISYDAASQSAVVGSGLIWDDVYAALEPYNVSVVGGRVTGIGVAGFALGGGMSIQIDTPVDGYFDANSTGYSWKTNQYGLTVDNILAYELVLPTGKSINVSESTYPDLFFGLKGGYNNFGIVTKFVFKTWPQTAVWGGIVFIEDTYADQVNAFTADFASNVTDPKAALILSYTYVEGTLSISAQLFYDAPLPPPGIFDDLLAIPSLSKNVSTTSYLSLIRISPSNETANFRGYYENVPIADITPAILDTVAEEVGYYGNLTAPYTGFLVSVAVEPFLPTILSHGGPSAYPFSRAQRFLPFNIYNAWSLSGGDTQQYLALTQMAQAMTNAAADENQNVYDAPRYPNYALYGTPLDKIYGDNLPILEKLKQLYDPENVMGLAGGWKFGS